ncbi:ergosterol biosynthesis ERG4/ERG24 family-domain-containing protein [Mycena sanguinolenta]|nr:ergosterol biosynthesis ERG4/ERG24 family-domain-containing protein [Mycena sanguinolenta]
MRTRLDALYQGKTTAPVVTTPAPPIATSSRAHFRTSPQKPNFTRRYQQSGRQPVDEIDTFIKLAQEDFENCDPIAWWYARRFQFPRLYRLARDVLAIPGSAVAVERIFSDTLSLRRSRLSAETISTLMIVKQPLKLAHTAIDELAAICGDPFYILAKNNAVPPRLRPSFLPPVPPPGFSTLLLALGLTCGLIYRNGPQAFTFFYEKYVGFITAAIIMSSVQAVACYAASFRPGALLALGGNSGNFIYDFYIGRELNPFSWGSFDLKTFNELRPGLILWVLLDISMVCEQATRRGGFSQVTDSLWLVLLFQGLYVSDSLYNETGIFAQMDITTDGFGFMLSFGDLAWVPFTFCLQARYLVFNPIVLGPVATTLILLVNFTGYYIFRVANAEKNDFRNGKNPKNLQFMTTESGSKLLTSGWWGRSRHPNYFGDLLMSVSWSLPTGFSTPIPYFYILYFTVLLVHRQRRDDEACGKKYGKDWKKYMELLYIQPT